MENEHRIYGKSADINTSSVQDLFNARAKSMGRENPYTSVLLGDQNYEYAKEWNSFEKEHILPQLKLDENCSFLDIGCGLGRWAESVIPLCGYYCGVDFSSEMIKTAKNRIHFENKKYDFIQCSFQNVAGKLAGKKFNRVIVSYICMYINDEDLKNCFESLNSLLAPHCILYLIETVGVKERLTLKDFYSSAMKTDYSTIYRTPQEYEAYYKQFLYTGGIQSGFMPHLNKEKEYSETDRWYTIIER
ncbi:MAG: class I SAM-dependent methyltransferase [Treponema sp.]|nr:class I SAM-dependent methyltransferase [Treponema sp.]